MRYVPFRTNSAILMTSLMSFAAAVALMPGAPAKSKGKIRTIVGGGKRGVPRGVHHRPYYGRKLNGVI